MFRGAGISPFMLGWTLSMLTGYSANLVRGGSHAETGRVGKDGRGGGERGGMKSGWGVMGQGLGCRVVSWMAAKYHIEN